MRPVVVVLLSEATCEQVTDSGQGGGRLGEFVRVELVSHACKELPCLGSGGRGDFLA